MNVQNRPQFVLATPNREFSAGILRKYLYSAKSYAEVAPAKKYLLSYYARGKNCVYKWDFKSQTFESYPKKIITDFHIQKDVVEFVNTEEQVTGVFDIQSWFFRDTAFYTPEVNPAQPRVYRKPNGRYCINIFPGFLHSNPPPFHEFSQEICDQVKLVLNYIKEVLCSSDKKQAYYMMNMIMRIAIGQKLQKTMFLYSGSGTGKIMLTWFL